MGRSVTVAHLGLERARALVKFFTTKPALTANGLPVALFAARPVSRNHSRRPQETLQPLAATSVATVPQDELLAAME